MKIQIFLALVFLDQVLKKGKMFLECFFAFLCGSVVCYGFSAHKCFGHMDKFMILEVTKMRCQVAICDIQKFFERIEIKLLIDH